MLGVAGVAAQARAMGRFAEGKKPLSEAVARAGAGIRAPACRIAGSHRTPAAHGRAAVCRPRPGGRCNSSPQSPPDLSLSTPNLIRVLSCREFVIGYRKRGKRPPDGCADEEIHESTRNFGVEAGLTLWPGLFKQSLSRNSFRFLSRHR